MRNFWKPIVIIVAALGLSGCGTLTEIAADNSLAQLEFVQKAVAKGDQVADDIADKLAVGFDKYCSPVGNLPRKIVRDKVNERLLVLGSQYRVNDFCGVVAPGTPTGQ